MESSFGTSKTQPGDVSHSRNDDTNHTAELKSAIGQRPAHQGLGWGLAGDPMSDFPLTSAGSFGHNGAFGAIVWIDPSKGLVRIFLEHRLGAGNESNIFMAMAGSAVAN